MPLLARLRAASLQQQLILLALGVVVIGALLLAVYFSVLRTPYGVLFSNLKPQDAATIVAELDKRKVPYKLEDGGATILAPQDQVAKARLDLLSAELPLKGAVGFELFNKSDMGLTEFAQQINYQRALQGELARTILSLESVREARVHLALPEHTIFAADRQPPKASVILTMNGEAGPSPGVAKGIQRLVAAAVPDLRVEDVVVLDGRGGLVSSAAEPGLAADGGERDALEEGYEASVRQALQESFPDKTFDVAVSVSFAPTAVTAPDPLAPGAPLGRGHSLRVVVTPRQASDSVAENAILNVASSAIQADLSRGDLVLITPPVSAAAAAAASPAAGAVAEADGIKPSDIRALIIGAGLILIAAAFIFIRRQNAAAGLTEAQRRRYATRLRALLEAEG